MPTYEYRCRSCGESLEIVHSIHGGPPETCPSCGARDTLRKSFAPPTIVFKGSGWAKKERSTRPASSGSGESESRTGQSEKSATGTSGESATASKDAAAAGTSSGTGRDGAKADSTDR
jgi:putative FmdB family regulatory protein